MESVDMEKQAEPTITMKMRGRPVSHEEARESAQRLINSHFKNPDSARCQIPANPADDDLIVMDYIRERSAKDELDKLGHGIAFDAAVSIIESNCCRVDGVDPVATDFFDVGDEGIAEGAEEGVKESVLYLDMRGLIERHENNPDFVAIRNESEAIA